MTWIEKTTTNNNSFLLLRQIMNSSDAAMVKEVFPSSLCSTHFGFKSEYGYGYLDD